MNPEDLRKPMTAYDWEIVGHQYRKNDLPTLPRARLDIPLPATLEECHTIAHRLSGLSQAIGQAIRLASTSRSGMLEVKGLINQSRQQFQILGKEMERELREAEEMANNSANTVERLRAVE
jgi:hypothetical protein